MGADLATQAEGVRHVLSAASIARAAHRADVVYATGMLVRSALGTTLARTPLVMKLTLGPDLRVSVALPPLRRLRSVPGGARCPRSRAAAGARPRCRPRSAPRGAERRAAAARARLGDPGAADHAAAESGLGAARLGSARRVAEAWHRCRRLLCWSPRAAEGARRRARRAGRRPDRGRPGDRRGWPRGVAAP